MRRTCQPLSQAYDVFEPPFLGSDRESHRALNHVRIDRRTIVGSLNIPQSVRNALNVAHVGDCDLSAARL
jgi:hypothetical protein